MRIIVLGAGPIIIGQGCEFDYSGTRVCKKLKDLGHYVILINPNPATVMTDLGVADRTYLEPLIPEMILTIIDQEKPDALMPIAGGQTALNLAVELSEELRERGITILGVDVDAIRKAEDRQNFRNVVESIGLRCARGAIITDNVSAERAVVDIGLPVIIRPSFTLGGLGGGIAYNTLDYKALIAEALMVSSQIQVDQSLIGWKEYEMEVALDNAGNGIIVCAIENIDPMGVHTGDSVTVSPVMTLSDKEYQKMRNSAIAILRAIGIKGSGANVQFAVNPQTGEQIVIEMNPRVSRSSALASKATGFPIATISAAMAVGYTLDNIRNECTHGIPASFEPTIDYVIVKMPRFDFSKFDAPKILSTAMKSVGEVMAIGANFKQALQKALCSLEEGYTGLDERGLTSEILSDHLSILSPDKVLYIADAIRQGMPVDLVCQLTHYDPWFVRQIVDIVHMEDGSRSEVFCDTFQTIADEHKLSCTTHKETEFIYNEECAGVSKAIAPGHPGVARASEVRADEKIAIRNKLLLLKKEGISDARIAKLLKCTERAVQQKRWELGVRPLYKRVDTCAGEFKATTYYMYSCYAGDYINTPECESRPSNRDKIIILGNGCTRIGQGIEFDYACVHASMAARKMGYETVMINSNPSTVSTDYDVSDRLYFEPVTRECVLEVLAKESQNGKVIGVVVQMGGQTPLKLAKHIKEAGYNILGTSIETIDMAEDREKFRILVDSLGLRSPQSEMAYDADSAVKAARDLTFPLLLRPSYVLGGESMAVVSDESELLEYLERNTKIFLKGPLLVDKFLTDSIEVDVEAICDGEKVMIVGIMEHIEAAGVHSGDSACSIPTRSIAESMLQQLKKQTEMLAISLGIIGLLNVQFAIKDNILYLLEANPRASRTVPFVIKATGIPVVELAMRVMCGHKLICEDEDDNICRGEARFDKKTGARNGFCIKMPVFPFNKFATAETLLGPQMRSTGESMGLGLTFGEAFAKAYISAGNSLPSSGTVLISICNNDKNEYVAAIANRLINLGFNICATRGTADFLHSHNINVDIINKVQQGRPHIIDALVDGKISLIINTSMGKRSVRDSISIRRAAVDRFVPCVTTLTGAMAIVEAIQFIKTNGSMMPIALQGP